MMPFGVQTVLALACLVAISAQVSAQTSTTGCCSSNQKTCNVKRPKLECLQTGGTWFPTGTLPPATCKDKASDCTDNSQCCGSMMCEIKARGGSTDSTDGSSDSTDGSSIDGSSTSLSASVDGSSTSLSESSDSTSDDGEVDSASDDNAKGRCVVPTEVCGGFKDSAGAAACQAVYFCKYNTTRGYNQKCVPNFITNEAPFVKPVRPANVAAACCSRDQVTCTKENNLGSPSLCKSSKFSNVWLPAGAGPGNNTALCISQGKSNDCAKNTDCCGMLVCAALPKKSLTCHHPQEVCNAYKQSEKICKAVAGCKWLSGKCIPSYETSIYNATLKALHVQPKLLATPLNGNPDSLGLCKGFVGAAQGDPHISSFDRRKYNCQGTGAFVLAKAPGLMEVQAIFDKKEGAQVSVGKGVAISYPALGDVPKIQVSIAHGADKTKPTTYPISDSCSAYIYIDGIKQVAKRGSPLSNGGSYSIQLNADGVVDIQFFNTSTTPPTPVTSVRVNARGSATTSFGCAVNIAMCMSLVDTGLRSKTFGLLGSPNGNRDDEWMSSTGVTMPIVPTGEAAYAYCTKNHCVKTAAESLFIYEEKSFDALNSCGSPFPGEPNIENPPANLVAICGDDADCLTEGVAGNVDDATRNLEDGALLVNIASTPSLVPDARFNIAAPPVVSTVGCCSEDHITCSSKPNLGSRDACLRSRSFNVWLPDGAGPGDNQANCISMKSPMDCANHRDCCGNLVCAPTPGLGTAQFKCHHPSSLCSTYSGGDCANAAFCKWSGNACSASFDVSLYNTTVKAALRAPAVPPTPLQGNADLLGQCKGFVGHMYGDPHFSTFDRRTYNCMGTGAFVLVKSPGKLQIQGLFEKSPKNSASVTKAIAIDYPAIPGVPRIQVSLIPSAASSPTTYMLSKSCAANIRFDGVLQAVARDRLLSGSSYAIKINPDGGTDIQFYNISTTPRTPTTAIRIRVEGSPTGTWGCMMDIKACLALEDTALRSNTVGLFGTPNGNRNDDWTTATGQVVPLNTTGQGAYNYCTTHHCVKTPAESLFVYGTKSFTDLYSCNSPFPGEPDVLLAPPEIRQICGENPDCLMEGMLGGAEEAIRNLEQQELVAEIIACDGIAPNVTFDIPLPKYDACLYPTPGKNTCPDDVVLLNSPTTQMPLFVKSPINIVAQSGNNVTFNISNPFGDNVNALYYQFSEDIDLLCKEKENLASCMQPVTVTAACMAGRDTSHQGTNRFAIVDMWFVDPEAIKPDDRVTIPACCHPDPKHASTNTALFSYKVYCESRCPSTLSSRLRLRH